MKKIVLILFLGFFSCDEYITYSYYIDNQTEDSITVVFSEVSPYFSIDPANLIFPPKTKKMFHIFYDIGRNYDNVHNYTAIKETDVNVIISSGRRLQKQIWVANNWECNGDNNRGWIYTFIIT